MMSESQPYAAGLALNQILAPFLFCALIYQTSFQNVSLQQNAGRLFALCCVFESALALAVYFGIAPQPFLAKYSFVGMPVDEGMRQAGTLDHPLILGLLLAAGIPMVAYFKSRIISQLSILIIVAGISVAQSRIAIIAAVVGIAYLFLFGEKKFGDRITLLIAAVAGYALLDISGIFQGLVDRINYDAGSSQARQLAVQLFVENWREFSVSGVGLEASKDYFLSRGLFSSGESAAIGYAVGIGIPLTALYFSVIIWLIGRGIRLGTKLSPASTAAIIVFVSVQFYSSIGTEGAAGMILWTTIGIALATPQSLVGPRELELGEDDQAAVFK